jgi:hypothetical protein
MADHNDDIRFVGWRCRMGHAWAGVVSGGDRPTVAERLRNYLRRERGVGLAVVLAAGVQPHPDDERATPYGRPTGQPGRVVNHERTRLLVRNGTTTTNERRA